MLLIFVGQRYIDAPPELRRSTGTPAKRSAVEKAYVEFWRVWTEANVRLDASLMGSVATGEALERSRREIVEARTSGERRLISIEHDLKIAFEGSEAVVTDRHTIRVSKIGEPIPEGETSVRTYRLRMDDGVWKVSRIPK